MSLDIATWTEVDSTGDVGGVDDGRAADSVGGESWRDTPLASTRDAGVWGRPNVRSAKAVHVAVDLEAIGRWPGTSQDMLHAMAACDPGRMVLDMSLAGPADEVPERARCRRRGCASRWPDAKRVGVAA